MSARMILDRTFELELGGTYTSSFQADLREADGKIVAEAAYCVDIPDDILTSRMVDPKPIWKQVFYQGEEIELTEGEQADARKILERTKNL